MRGKKHEHKRLTTVRERVRKRKHTCMQESENGEVHACERGKTQLRERQST